MHCIRLYQMHPRSSKMRRPAKQHQHLLFSRCFPELKSEPSLIHLSTKIRKFLNPKKLCLFISSITSCLALPGHTHFDERQPPAGYGQMAAATAGAAAMPPPGAPSWASESHQAGPPPAGPPPPAQASGSAPQEMASMGAAFSVQQPPSAAGSATPSLSSCSTVSTAPQ